VYCHCISGDEQIRFSYRVRDLGSIRPHNSSSSKSPNPSRVLGSRIDGNRTQGTRCLPRLGTSQRGNTLRSVLILLMVVYRVKLDPP